MKDETPEVSQEDPIVMYLIVNETLGMSIGKTAAQTAHAAQYLMMQYMDLKKESSNLQKMIYAQADLNLREILMDQYKEMGRKLSIVGEWLTVGVRKVVLKADAKEWKKVKEAYPDCALVVDAGLTEIASGSETVIGLWPMRRSQANRIISRLQVLK